VPSEQRVIEAAKSLSSGHSDSRRQPDQARVLEYKPSEVDMASIHCLAMDIGAESGARHAGTARCGANRAVGNAPLCQRRGAACRTVLHWDVLRIWTEVKSSLAQAIHQCGASLASVGIDTWGVDFALLDRNRGTARQSVPLPGQPDRWYARGSLPPHAPRQVYGRTGIEPAQLATLYQLLSMVTSGSPVLDIAETFLTTPDLLQLLAHRPKGLRVYHCVHDAML